jgi:hypothetical protein
MTDDGLDERLKEADRGVTPTRPTGERSAEQKGRTAMIIKLDDPFTDLGEDLDTRNMANETPERIKAALREAGSAYDQLRKTSDVKRKGLAVTGLEFTIGGDLVVADLAAFDAWAAKARSAFIAQEADEAANGPPVLDIDELLGRFRH